VALTSPAFVKRASEFYAAGRWLTDENRSKEQTEHLKKRFAEPWKAIHADAERAAEEIIVSHRAQRKVSGALHDDLPWGDTGEDVVSGKIAYRLYSQRKDGKAVRQRIQPALMRAIGPDRSAFVPTNSNHHMVIYRDAAGKLKYQVVAMFDAAMRVARREPIVNRAPEPGATEVRSLCIGDMIERQTDDKKSYWVIKALWPNGKQTTIQPHNAAREVDKYSPTTAKLFREGARKVVVDPIGRVFPAND
jgi:hypothetical protein